MNRAMPPRDRGDRDGNRQPRILGWLDARFGSSARVQFLLQEVLGCANTEIRVIGDFECSPARPFRKSAPRVRLQAPGDPAEKKLLVARPARLAEGLPVLVLELPDRHVTQALDLLSNLCFVHFLLCSHGVNQHSHGRSLSLRSQVEGRPEQDSEDAGIPRPK
jgi:hypothetical protein